MGKKRAQFEQMPYHDVIVAEMNNLNRTTKHVAPRVVQVARMVALTKMPMGKVLWVSEMYFDMIRRVGGMKHKRFSTTDRSWLYRARDALVAAAELERNAKLVPDESAYQDVSAPPPGC